MEVIEIRRSQRKHRKYVATVIIDNRIHRNIHFGDLRYQHYRDSTPLKLYSHLDHNDYARKLRYHARHAKNNKPAGMLAKEFLW
jgi:hypothetical protein